jgi:hypothetical protein
MQCFTLSADQLDFLKQKSKTEPGFETLRQKKSKQILNNTFKD